MTRTRQSRPAASIRQFAAERISALLARFVFEMRRAERDRDPEAIHDLRVSIRRLSESLRTFRVLLPRREARRVRSQLRRLMDLAAEVRNRDIALQLFDACGLSARSPLRRRQLTDREAALQALKGELRRHRAQDCSSRWRRRLGLAS